jgi:predicted nucleic acid-binding protein
MPNLEKQITNLKRQITDAGNRLHHVRRTTPTYKLEHLQSRIQYLTEQLNYYLKEQHEQAKRDKKHAKLLQQVANAKHHSLIKSEQQRQLLAIKQQQRRERYLQTKLNETTQT